MVKTCVSSTRRFSSIVSFFWPSGETSMAKSYKTVKGVQFAKGVDTSGIDWDSPPSPDLVAALRRMPKVRITTMVDLDVLEALKKVAEESTKKVGYQTVLNVLLRAALFPAARTHQTKAKKKKSNRRKAG
jgi:hypothetical protein